MKRLNIIILVCNSLVLLLTLARLLAVDNIYYQLAVLVIVAILLIVSLVLTTGIISILRREKKRAPIAVMTDAFRNALRDWTAWRESEGDDVCQ